MQSFNQSSNEPQFACSEVWKNWWSDAAIRSRILDGFERVAILVLFIGFLQALIGSIAVSVASGNSVVIGDVMLLITETMMVFLVLFRRPAKDLSLRVTDWGLAFSATCLSLLARPIVGEPHIWDNIAVLMTISGLCTQLISKITLGRRFGIVAANRGICSAGPYRLVRHPIYMGYVLLHSGFFLLNPSLWNLAVFATLYAVKIPRILAEERLLSRDPEYKAYMSKVRYRLLPLVF